jgi:hypothetical protein
LEGDHQQSPHHSTLLLTIVHRTLCPHGRTLPAVEPQRNTCTQHTTLPCSCHSEAAQVSCALALPASYQACAATSPAISGVARSSKTTGLCCFCRSLLVLVSALSFAAALTHKALCAACKACDICRVRDQPCYSVSIRVGIHEAGSLFSVHTAAQMTCQFSNRVLMILSPKCVLTRPRQHGQAELHLTVQMHRLPSAC